MPRLIACLFLAVPVLGVCAPFLFTSRQLVADDFRDYYGPHAERAREEVRRTGELPRWNPWQFAGTPFLGSGQNNFYYPPNALFLVLPVDRAFGIVVALHLLLAAAGLYRLARSYGLDRDASVVSGLAFGLSFCLIARIGAGHLPHFVAACQAPLVLFLLRRAILRPGPGRLAGLAAGGALPLLAGYPHFVYQLGLLCVAVAAWEIHRRRSAAQRPLPAVGGVIAAAAGALGLAALHVLPLLETAAASSRAGASADLVGSFHDFEPSQLVHLTVPRFFWRPASDPWLLHEKAMYLGLLPLALAGWAFRSSEKATVRFFGVVGLVALIEAATGVLIRWLPWYGGFRLPERIAWIPVLCLALLAGFGWQAWKSSEAPSRKTIGTAGAAVAAWALLLGLGFQARAGTLLFLGAAVAAAAALTLSRRWAWAGAVVVALDLGTVGVLELRTAPPEAPSPWYESSIRSTRELYRVLDLTGYKATPVARGFRLLRGYSHPMLRETVEFYGSAWEQPVAALDTLSPGGPLRDVSVLRDLNVRWIVAGGGPLFPDWKAVQSRGSLTLYEDPWARPEAFLVDGEGVVYVSRPGANRILVTVRAEGPATLAISEAWMAGWRAESGGRPMEIGRHRGALMSVKVPSGSSEILLTYAPAGWRIGRWISGLSLVALLAAAAASRFRRPV